jgi:hypothetical protein
MRPYPLNPTYLHKMTNTDFYGRALLASLPLAQLRVARATMDKELENRKNGIAPQPATMEFSEVAIEADGMAIALLGVFAKRSADFSDFGKVSSK